MKTFYVGAAKFFEFQCPDEILEAAIDKAKKCFYNNIAYDNGISMGYEKQEDNSYVSIYDKHLDEWLTDCSNQVASVYLKSQKVKICDLWVVKSKFGNIARNHTHSFSLFSGLLYLTSCSRSETVFYYKDHFLKRWDFFLGETLLNDPKNNIIHKVTPEKGKLIIWPSDIEHSINPHTSKDERYTIAFNTFINGYNDDPTGRLDIQTGNPYSQKFNFKEGQTR